MMRVNLLRPLGASADEADAPPPPGPREGGPWKPALLVLLLLLAAGVIAVGLGKPEWLHKERLTRLWGRPSSAATDSLQRAQAAAAQASRLVDARQEAAIEWLYQLELLLPSAGDAKAPITLTQASFTAAGDFLLTGAAVSAEALSALQEALVLVPGMELRESRAQEVAESVGPAFDFRFTGRLAPAGEDTTAGDTTEPLAAVRNRVVDSTAVSAHRDSLLRAMSEKGFSLATPRAVAPVRSGMFTARGWRLKATFAPGGETPVFTALREALELERHRGGPFAVQRISLEKQGEQKTVFLDILALTP